MRRVVAIDPGVEGALVVLADGAVEAVYDLPVTRDRTLSWIDGGRLLSLLIEIRDGGEPLTAVVERVQPMNKRIPGKGGKEFKGVSGGFSQGMTFGSILSALQCACCRIEFAHPATWKRDMGLSDSKATQTQRKHASLHKARLLFPDAPLGLVKHHNRAEALLIGYWFLRRQFSTVIAA